MDSMGQTAVEFMGRDQRLCTVSLSDVDWMSLDDAPKQALAVARQCSFRFPSDIGRFVDNVACVKWQLNPDGRFYMDDDGFGMTSDEEYDIYGDIDRSGKVVRKFATRKN